MVSPLADGPRDVRGVGFFFFITLEPSVERFKCLRKVKRFRGGLVFKAHRLLCNSTLGGPSAATT